MTTITPEWETDLIGEPATERNPHYYCDSPDDRPCPTGQHLNPHPGDGICHQAVDVHRPGGRCGRPYLHRGAHQKPPF